jgi:hypothetical protein
MTTKILQKLQEIEREKKVKILWASESLITDYLQEIILFNQENISTLKGEKKMSGELDRVFRGIISR